MAGAEAGLARDGGMATFRSEQVVGRAAWRGRSTTPPLQGWLWTAVTTPASAYASAPRFRFTGLVPTSRPDRGRVPCAIESPTLLAGLTQMEVVMHLRINNVTVSPARVDELGDVL